MTHESKPAQDTAFDNWRISSSIATMTSTYAMQSAASFQGVVMAWGRTDNAVLRVSKHVIRPAQPARRLDRLK